MPVNGDGDKATKHFSLLHKTVITKLDPIIISHYHNYKPYSKINNNEWWTILSSEYAQMNIYTVM